MSQYHRAKLYSLLKPGMLRTVYLLVAVLATVLAAGAPFEWGGG